MFSGMGHVSDDLLIAFVPKQTGLEIILRMHCEDLILTLISSVPSANDVLVPETLLKKRKADAKLREEKQAKALELRKVC